MCSMQVCGGKASRAIRIALHRAPQGGVEHRFLPKLCRGRIGGRTDYACCAALAEASAAPELLPDHVTPMTPLFFPLCHPPYRIVGSQTQTSCPDQYLPEVTCAHVPCVMLWQAVGNITHGGLPRITITPLSPSYPGTSTQPRTSAPQPPTPQSIATAGTPPLVPGLNGSAAPGTLRSAGLPSSAAAGSAGASSSALASAPASASAATSSGGTGSGGGPGGGAGLPQPGDPLGALGLPTLPNVNTGDITLNVNVNINPVITGTPAPGSCPCSCPGGRGSWVGKWAISRP